MVTVDWGSIRTANFCPLVHIRCVHPPSNGPAKDSTGSHSLGNRLVIVNSQSSHIDLHLLHLEAKPNLGSNRSSADQRHLAPTPNHILEYLSLAPSFVLSANPLYSPFVFLSASERASPSFPPSAPRPTPAT